MTTGLPVSRYIQTSVVLSPNAAQANNVNTIMVIGDSNVIDTGQRYRAYSALTGVAADFGTSAPEYIAAALYFGQSPQPQNPLYIGRWAQAAVAGILKGGILTAPQQALSNFTGLTSSGFKIQVDGAGAPVAVTVGTLAGVGNLNAVATAINTGLTTASVGATCVWNASLGQFVFTSNTTGANSKVLPLVAPTSGNDLSAVILGTVLLGAVEVDGIAAETAQTACAAVEAAAPYFYGLAFATTHTLSVSEQTAIAAFTEGDGAAHLYAATTADTSHLSTGSTSNLGYTLQTAGYQRTFYQYSSLTAYAGVSALARMIAVDYTAQNSAITLAFKQEPGVSAETLTTNQANALDNYRANYLVKVNNGTQVLANGWCAGPAWVDVIAGMDALATNVQTSLYNVLYTQPKIPQTDPGMNQLVGAAEQVCQQFVRNGVLAPGIWTGPNIGSIKTGDTLSEGYYVYAPPVATQSAGDRGARRATTLQIAVKLAGAVQDVPAIITVSQ
jgi:hypothetical protein